MQLVLNFLSKRQSPEPLTHLDPAQRAALLQVLARLIGNVARQPPPSSDKPPAMTMPTKVSPHD